MTTVGKIEKSSPSKKSSRDSDLKLRRIIFTLPLAMLLFLCLYSVIAVRGFSIIPAIARRGMTAVPITTTLSGDRSNSVDSDKRNIISTRSSTTTRLLAGLFGEQAKLKNQNNTYISPTSDWQIYIDQSKNSLDRGGGATFDAFFSLCDISVNHLDADSNGAVEIQVIPAILPKPVSGGKAPWIRCIWNTNNKKNLVRPSPNMDVSNVDSVEKVYRVLTTHLGVTNISIEACECLKWKYKGNTYLESGEIKSAIHAYNQALAICEEASASAPDSNSAGSKKWSSIVLKQQEGIVLLLRSSAFLQQAQSHKEVLQSAIAGDGTNLPSSEILQSLLLEAMSPPSPSFSSESSLAEGLEDGDNTDSGSDGTASKTDGNNDAEESPVDGNATLDGGSENVDEESLSSLSSPSTYSVDPQTAVRLSALRTLKTNGSVRKAQLRKIQYRHGLYQTSLLQATRDSLRATEVLPSYPTAWLRAGEVLSDLWKIKESKQYYEKALSIDKSLEESLSLVLEGLESRQELVQQARDGKKWPENSLQLALDITC